MKLEEYFELEYAIEDFNSFFEAPIEELKISKYKDKFLFLDGIGSLYIENGVLKSDWNKTQVSIQLKRTNTKLIKPQVIIQGVPFNGNLLVAKLKSDQKLYNRYYQDLFELPINTVEILASSEKYYAPIWINLNQAGTVRTALEFKNGKPTYAEAIKCRACELLHALYRFKPTATFLVKGQEVPASVFYET